MTDEPRSAHLADYVAVDSEYFSERGKVGEGLLPSPKSVNYVQPLRNAVLAGASIITLRNRDDIYGKKIDLSTTTLSTNGARTSQ